MVDYNMMSPDFRELSEKYNALKETIVILGKDNAGWFREYKALEEKLAEQLKNHEVKIGVAAKTVSRMEEKLKVAEHLLEGIRHLEIMDFENPLNYQTSIRNSIATYKIKAK
jgi:hypothetical protein